jgi:DNA-binding transcriptional regulator LsrR (DeoR family)
MTDALAPPAPGLLDDVRDLAIRAAWHYHVEGLTQAEVAAALGVSRAKVIRLLAAARAARIVEIDVHAPGSAEVALERALAARYGCAEVIVVPAAPGHVAASVGAAAAAWLAREVRPGLALGIGWGDTLDHVARVLAPPPAAAGLRVVSLLGGMARSQGINPTQVARGLADTLGADCFLLAAPLVVADAATRAALWAEPSLAGLRTRARACDVALVSVGDLSAGATLFREHLLPLTALESLRAAGAVGDVLGHFVDAAGREVEHEVNHRVMAVDLEDLSQVPRLALVSGGAPKVDVLRAALAALPVAVLITDAEAATGLLQGSEGAVAAAPGPHGAA